MPRWQVAYLAGVSAVVGFALCYMLCDFGQWPLLMYEPYSGRWLVADVPPSSAVMVYPGMLVWGTAGALVSAAVTIGISSRLSRPVSAMVLRLAGAWALSLVCFVALYFFWALWPF